MRHFFRSSIQVLLLLSVCGFAWINQGLVRCGGLFLLDLPGKDAGVKGCVINDSLSAGGWSFDATYGSVSHDFFLRHHGESEMHSWTMSDEGVSSFGGISVVREYRHLELEVDLYSLPLFVVSSRWYTLDSLAYAGVAFGRASLEHDGFTWKSSSGLDFVPVVDGIFKDQLTFRRLYAGSKSFIGDFRTGLTYGNTVPDMENRTGFVFSDSSRFWEWDARYQVKVGKNKFSLLYGYVDADLRLFGLLREKGEDGELDEKRFAYVPLGLDINLFYGAYSRELGKESLLELHAAYLTAEVNIPWESRRFHETLAPNRSVSDAKLRALSFVVFQRSFRVYGDVDSYVADFGASFSSTCSIGRWRLSPEVSADLFYAESDVHVYLRKEKSGMFYVKQSTDEFKYEASVAGAVIFAASSLESPGGRFFASVGVGQLIPFSYSYEKIEVDEEPETEPQKKDGGGGGGKHSSSHKETPEAEKTEKSEKKDNVLMKKLRFVASHAFRNGFAVSAGIGVKF